MFFEPTTIASMLAVIGRTVERYGHDPKDLYDSIGVEADQMDLPGWRVPLRVMQRAWEEAYATTGDPCLGLRVAEQLRPGHLHVFGLAWMASSSVADAMHRLGRYQRILSTALDTTFEASGDEYVLAVQFPAPVPAPNDPWPAAPMDALFGTILALCRMLAGEDFAPVCVELRRSDFGAVEDYRKSFRGPVVFAAARDAIRFRRADCDTPVVASARELAMEVDRIAERYLRSLDSSPIVTQLRSILVDLLPSGAASKKTVAERTLYDALKLIEERSGEDPMKAFKKAVENVKPTVEVKSRRVGGSTYQVPIEVRPNRRLALSFRWLILSAKARGEKTMREKLAGEFLEAADSRGSAVKKKEDTHRMAEANKAFAHYRW